MFDSRYVWQKERYIEELFKFAAVPIRKAVRREVFGPRPRVGPGSLLYEKDINNRNMEGVRDHVGDMFRAMAIVLYSCCHTPYLVVR